MQVLSLSSAERFGIGDFAEVQAGSRVEVLTGDSSMVIARPFIQVAVHPAAMWLVTYSLATATDTQDYDSATGSDGELPTYGYVGGRLRAAGGLHQEISAARKARERCWRWRTMPTRCIAPRCWEGWRAQGSLGPP